MFCNKSELLLLLFSCRCIVVNETHKYDGYNCKGVSSIAILIALVGLIKNTHQISGARFLFLYI